MPALLTPKAEGRGHNINLCSEFIMAKSKSGGTRAMIRGRVGSDVYSIGRNALGKKQQVVRSIAETVANPQTVSQMKGRMIMSTVMQALSVLRPIVDHSFDNVTGVQPNLSEFIRRNYALIKADVAANPSSGNKFGLVIYGSKVASRGQYEISDGNAAVPAAATLAKATGILSLNLGEEALTLAGLKAAIGLGSEEYITIVGLTAAGAAEYVRVHINYSLSDDTVISADNLDTVLTLVGNATPTLGLSGQIITLSLPNIAGCCAIIVTRKSTSGFTHSNAVLGDGSGFDYAANTAIATYPVGEQKFLNGGGEDSQSSVTPTPSPTPTPGESYALTITKQDNTVSVTAKVDGSAISSGDDVEAGKTVAVTVEDIPSATITVQLNGESLTGTSVDDGWSYSFEMPSQASTLAVTYQSL